MPGNARCAKNSELSLVPAVPQLKYLHVFWIQALTCKSLLISLPSVSTAPCVAFLVSLLPLPAPCPVYVLPIRVQACRDMCGGLSLIRSHILLLIPLGTSPLSSHCLCDHRTVPQKVDVSLLEPARCTPHAESDISLFCRIFRAKDFAFQCCREKPGTPPVCKVGM